MKPKLKTWVYENTEVGEWLTSVGARTAPLYAYRFHSFWEYLTKSGEFEGYTPGMLLDYQARSSGRDRVKIANRLGLFLKELGARLRPKTLTHYYSSTRSFFAYHGCNLPKRGFTLPENYKEPSPQLLTREDLVNVVGAAKLRDKAIYVTSFMGGMGWQEFNQFNHGWAEVGPQLEKGQDHIVFNLKARKKRRGLANGFFTVVGKDGVDLMREYLEKRGTPKDGEVIFLTRENTALAARTYRKNFENLCRRVGLIEGGGKGKGRTSRLGYSAHMGRDVYRTMFQRAGADPVVGEFCLGHAVDSNQYLQFTQIPEYVIEQYKVAEPLLSIVSNPDPKMVSRDEVERLTQENQVLRRELERQVNEINEGIREQARVQEKLRKQDAEIREMKATMMEILKKLEK